MSELLAVAPLLVLGAIAVVALLEWCIRRTVVGVTLVAVANLAEILLDRGLGVSFGSLAVESYDVVFVVLATAILARVLRGDRLGPLRLALAAVGVLAVLALLRGMGEFGLQPAVNEFRKTFYWITGALYVASAEPERGLFDRIGRIWLVVSALLLGLVLLRWASVATGLPLGPLALGERAASRELLDQGSLRVVHADDTLVLLQGFLIAVLAWRQRRDPWLGRLAVTLLAVVFLLQHRTIWVTTVVALGLVLLRDRDLGRRLTLLLAGAVLVAGVVVFALLDSGEADVGEQLAGAVSNSGTFEWRYRGWAALLTDEDTASATNTLVGRPFGTGWDRRVDGRLVEVAPHNYYVEAWLRVGALGLLVLVGVLGITARRLWRAPSRAGLLSDGTLLLLLATQLTFFLTYDPAPLQGIVTGLALAAAGGARGPARGDDRVIDLRVSGADAREEALATGAVAPGR